VALRTIARKLKNIESFDKTRIEVIKNHDLSKVSISVVIALYNYDKYIGSAMDSVLSNRFESCEIVVVNDASTDGSLSIVKEYLNRECALTIIDKKTNTGLAHTRNLGIELCRGDYVFLLDADNSILPGCLEKLYRYISTNSLDAAYCTINCMDEKGNFIKSISNKAYDYEKLKKGNYIDAMALYNRERLVAAGGFDWQMLRSGIGWEDHELWLRLGSLGYKVGHLDEVLCKYLIKDDSMLSWTHLFLDELTGYLKNKYP